VDTPELEVDDKIVLRPVNRRILPEVKQAYMEDPDATRSALPWLKDGEEAIRQIADLMLDLEMHRTGDVVHFWAIHRLTDNAFVGMIGLGDELQLAASAYNLGYWVVKSSRGRGITNRCVDRIFQWLEQTKGQALIEITVHPHNEAGLSTCRSIMERWGGLAVEGFVGIEVDGRTVPHILHLVQIDKVVE
jgi:RimJ/RimL family protein N-acetyltransferase